MGIRADLRTIFDRGSMFIDAIIITSNGTRSNIHCFSNGSITDASDVLSVKEGDIHASLFVKDAFKGNKVEVLLKHLESASSVPPVTVVVQKDGDSTLSFTFSPPAMAQGWPKGNYELHVSSADASEPQIYKFKVE